MSNIIPINKDNKDDQGGFLGAYIEAQNNQRIPEEVYFVAGVILTVGLPEAFFSIYGGVIPFIVFASSLIAAVGLGWTLYNYQAPYQTLSLAKEIAPRVSTSRKNTTKKAA